MSSWRIWVPSLAFTMALGAVGAFLLVALEISGSLAGLIIFGLIAVAGLIGGWTAERLPLPPSRP